MQPIVNLDEELSLKLRIADRPGKLRVISSILAHSGDSWFWLIGLLVIWLTNGETWRYVCLVFGIFIVFTAGIVMTIKLLVRRQRPEGDWGAIYRSTDPHSFPSGHAARAAMLAILGLGIGPIWFGILLFVWAPFVCLARVAMGVHYLSDVVVGYILGVLVGIGGIILLPLTPIPGWFQLYIA